MTVKKLTITSKSETRSGYFAQETSKARGIMVGRKKGEWQGAPYDLVVLNALLQTTGKTKGKKEWKFRLYNTPYNMSYMKVTFSADIIPELIECLKKIYEDFYGAMPTEMDDTKVDVSKEEQEAALKFYEKNLRKPEKTAGLTKEDIELLGG